MKIYFIITLVICCIFLVSAQPIAAQQKRIEVDLTNQRLYAYEEEIKVYDFVVSTGKIRMPTPTGRLWPWIKLRYSRMQGGTKSRGDYYNLPNVPYVIYFYNAHYPKYRGYNA